jgi:hypothetical protein
MSYKLTKFGATDLPGYNASSDNSTGAIESLLTKVVGGYIDQRGTQQASQQPGIVSKTFLVDYDPHTIDETFRGLRALVGKRERLYREWRDGRVEWCHARMLPIRGDRQPRHNLIEATIDFERISPVWYFDYHGDWLLDSGIYLDSGYNLDGGDIEGTLSSGANNITCPNDGNGRNFAPIITITGGTGTNISAIRFRGYDLTDPSFTTNRDITWAGTMTDGDVLIVDCGKQSITFEGVADYDGLTVDNKPYWFVIPAGGANLTINCTGTIGSGTTYSVSYWEASE